MNENARTPAADATNVSVVVCTYNRSQRLETALAHIENAAARARVAVEIVVVDNNSRDDTKARRRSCGPSLGRYPFATCSSAHRACRSPAIADCRRRTGSVVAFTDDDCVVDPGWIAALCDEFAADPDVAVVGGRVDLYSPEDRPVSIRPIAERVRYTDATQIYGLVMGCNLAVRRGVAERIGGFDPAFGGSKGVVADDIEFVYRAFEARARHRVHARRASAAQSRPPNRWRVARARTKLCPGQGCVLLQACPPCGPDDTAARLVGDSRPARASGPQSTVASRDPRRTRVRSAPLRPDARATRPAIDSLAARHRAYGIVIQKKNPRNSAGVWSPGQRSYRNITRRLFNLRRRERTREPAETVLVDCRH